MKPRAYWHIHHKILVELATEPIANRIAYIKANKPKDEVALRLRLLRPVKSRTITRLLAEYEKATASVWAKYEKATASVWAKYEKATASALAEYEKAKASALVPIEALHAKECKNCPWDGKTIFPEVNEA